MAALIGKFSDYQQSKWLDQLCTRAAYTPPATLYLALLTSAPLHPSAVEVPTTQTLRGFTDFAVDAAVNTRITSASHPFAAADQSVVVSGGAGWTPGTYAIGSLTGSAANLNASPAAAGATGGTGNVVRSTGYARTALPSNFFAASVNGTTVNANPVTLPAPTGDWGTILCVALYDASTGGNLLLTASVSVARPVIAGDQALTIAAGALAISRT